MRSSVGATWIFSICLTFIIIFVAYLTISLNYSKAFRAKNEIVSRIEENEGYNNEDTFNDGIINYLVSSGYSSYGRCQSNIVTEEDEEWKLFEPAIGISDEILTSGNASVCIYKNQNISSSNECPSEAKRTTYKVITFFKFDLPVVGNFMSFQVSGETKYFCDYSE